MLTAYGVFVLPARLPTSYARALEHSQASYATLTSEPSSSLDELNRVSGDLNVIFNRLVAMEGTPERYWQWAEFSEQHAKILSSHLASQRTSMAQDAIDETQQQISAFRGRAQKTYEFLSQGTSELRDAAFLHVVAEQYAAGVSATGIGQQDSLLQRLEMLVASESSLPDAQLVDAKAVYAELLLDSCWYSDDTTALPRNLLAPDRSRLLEASAKFARIDASLRVTDFRLAAVGRLFAIYSNAEEVENPKAAPDGWEAELPGTLAAETLWQTRLAEVVLGAIDGDWNDVAFLLGRKNSDNPAAVRHGLARWVCRLSTSNLAKQDAPWREAYPVGMQLVSQIAPQLPEFNELLWRLANQNAGLVAESDSPIPAELVAAVAGGQSIPMRHSVLALSSILLDKPQVARSHLQLVQRAGGSLTVLSQTVLWAVNSTADGDHARLEGLAQMLTELEPDSGFHWFVLGVIEKRAGDYSAAETAFEKALALLGEIPAIEELLSTVRADAKRAEAEQAK